MVGKRPCWAVAAALAAIPALAQAQIATPPGQVVSTTTGAALVRDFQFIYGGPVNPPFTLTSTVSVVRATQVFLTIRTYIDPRDSGAKAGQAGGWVMPIAELRGLTRAQILDRWALPIYADGTRNNMITLALAPAGTLMWSGEAGPIHASIDGTGDWGAGGGTQYYLGWGAAGVNRYQLALSDYVLAAPMGAGPLLALGPRMSGNAGRIGTYLDALSRTVTPFGDLDGVLTSLDVIDLASPANAAPLAQATGQLGPDRYGARTLVADTQRRMFLDGLARGAGDERGLWKRAVGVWGGHGAEGDSAGFDTETWGVMGGLTLPAGERTLLDLGISYLATDMTWRDVGSSHGRAEAILAGAGLRWEGVGTFASAQLAAGYGWSKIDRRIVIADTGLLPRGFSTAIDRTARGTPHGVDLGARAQAGLMLAAGAIELRPFIGLEYGRFDRAAFTENRAGDADLRVDGQAYDALRGRLGLGAAAEVAHGWTFDAGAVASRRLGGGGGGITAGLSGQAGTFTVTGPREDAWLFEPSAGLTLRFNGGQARLGYQGEVGSGQAAHSANAELVLHF